MTQPTAPDQDLAYERAVRATWEEPELCWLVEADFLHPNPGDALAQFERSEAWARVRRLMGIADVPAGARIADFGGGRGLIAAMLARDGFDVTLCERNPSAVCGTGAAEAAREAAGADFAIATGPLESLETDPFDAIVCRAVLHHLPDLPDGLRAVHDRLAPGAPLIAAEEPTVRRKGDVAALQAAHPFVRFGVEEVAYRVPDWIGALRAAGFVEISERFPVAWPDYRRFVRPRAPQPLAAALYARYRVRAACFPEPGAMRSFIARRPRVASAPA